MSLTAHKKPRGAPFQKGHDPRRNLSGGSSPKAKQDFKREFQAILEDEATPGRLRRIVRTLFRKAEAGQPWAIQEVLDRGLGKPAQSIGLKDETPKTLRVIYDKGAALPPPEAETRALPAAPADEIILGMPRPGWAVPEDKPPAKLTDAELEAEIVRAEAEEGSDVKAS